MLVQYSHDLSSTAAEAQDHLLTADRIDQYEKADQTPFIVENRRIEIDGRFVPYNSGSRGFDVSRRVLGKNALPQRRISMFVSFEVPMGLYYYLCNEL